jgi:hypothetical protein
MPKYGPVYPGTEIPTGQLGYVAAAVDRLKAQSDRILEWYLKPNACLDRGGDINLQVGLDVVASFTEQLKCVRFKGEVEECETVSYLDDPAFVKAVRDVINTYREERKKR